MKPTDFSVQVTHFLTLYLAGVVPSVASIVRV